MRDRTLKNSHTRLLGGAAIIACAALLLLPLGAREQNLPEDTSSSQERAPEPIEITEVYIDPNEPVEFDDLPSGNYTVVNRLPNGNAILRINNDKPINLEVVNMRENLAAGDTFTNHVFDLDPKRT